MKKKYFVACKGHTFTVEILDGATARINGTTHSYELHKIGGADYVLLLDKRVYPVFDSSVNGSDPGFSTQIRELSLNSRSYSATVDDERSLLLKSLMQSSDVAEGEMQICAPMPGLVVRIEVSEGDQVKQGQGLVVLEAMKMENEIRSPAGGTVKKITAKEKLVVEKGQELVLLHLGRPGR